MPLAAQPAVLTAPAALLDRVACFPRALFRFELKSATRTERSEHSGDFDEAERELGLSVLFAARSTSRQSPYQARVLFDLERGEVERLRSLPLTNLQRLACEPESMQCALPEWDWFWRELFVATRPELRRQLALMALQPRIAEWPLRRPPQASL